MVWVDSTGSPRSLIRYRGYFSVDALSIELVGEVGVDISRKPYDHLPVLTACEIGLAACCPHIDLSTYCHILYSLSFGSTSHVQTLLSPGRLICAKARPQLHHLISSKSSTAEVGRHGSGQHDRPPAALARAHGPAEGRYLQYAQAMTAAHER